MLFIIAVGFAIGSFVVAISSYYWDAEAVLIFTISLIAAFIFAVTGTIPASNPQVAWTHNVSNVQAFHNPNGGTVVTFNDATTNKQEGMDEGGDRVTVNVGNTSQSVLVKKCQSNYKLLVPWNATSCYYELDTPSLIASNG